MKVRHKGLIPAVLATVVAGGFAVTGASAEVVLTCGQTITQNTTLTADLGPCSNNGLIIGADGITLDLGGYHIFGTPNTNDGAGVYLLGRRSATVRNGTIRAFDGGVVIEGGTGNTARDLTIRDNIGKSAVTGSSKFGDGVAIMSSTSNQITGNLVQNNGPLAGIGVYSLIDSDHPRTTSGISQGNIIERNHVLDNITGRTNLTGTDNDGIRLENQAIGNAIRFNTVDNSGLDGIALFNGSRFNTIQGNTVTDNGFYRTSARRGSGIILFNNASGNLVVDNTVVHNADNGIVLQGQLGANAPASGNRIINNVALNNAALPSLNPTPGGSFGGPTYDLQDRSPNCDSNQWYGNTYGTAAPACTTTGGTQVLQNP